MVQRIRKPYLGKMKMIHQWNGFLEKARFARPLMRLMLNPLATEEVFNLSTLAENSRDQTEGKRVLSYAESFPSYRSLFNARHAPEPPKLGWLLNLPRSSLGGALGKFCKENALDPDFYPALDPTDEKKYLSLRMRQAHDVWHVLTGFEATIPGETGLQAFSAVQTRSPLSAALVAVGILHIAIKNTDLLMETLLEVERGVRLARNAEFLLGIAWENHWEENLEDLRMKWLHTQDVKRAA